MTGVDDRFDRLITEKGLPAAKQALDDVVQAGNVDNFDARTTMLTAGLTAIHGDGMYRRLVIEEFVEHLTVGNNDVLIVHMGADEEDLPPAQLQEAVQAWMQIAHGLAQRFREQGTEVTVVLASQTGKIEDIPEEVMVRKGWVRAGRVREALKPGDFHQRMDDAILEGDVDKAAVIFNEYAGQVEDFASGAAVEETLTREADILAAARHYYGGVSNAISMVTYLCQADADDFLQWQAQSAAQVLEGFMGGLDRYAALVDPTYVPPAPPEPDTEEATDGE